VQWGSLQRKDRKRSGRCSIGKSPPHATCKHVEIEWGPLYFEYDNDGTATYVEQTGACKKCKQQMRIKYFAEAASVELD